ncbi:MAG: heavy metal translocating P-type ATPase, partial [Planctomycetales bacterium]|nr:heavy metal translocating P-type ATPase [Planctomycetales bacterium]
MQEKQVAPVESDVSWKQVVIAAIAIVAIIIHLALRFVSGASEAIYNAPLLVALVLGGIPLVWDLLLKLFRREFGSDLLAGISIVTSVFLDEYLAGTLVVLMLSGGEALESYAVRSASSVLQALAKRMPSVAHRKQDSTLLDVPLADV